MGHSCRKLLRGSFGTLLIPPIIPLTSDTPRLHRHVSRSPVARRHANALFTKAAQIPMALRHHERRVATRSAHALQAFCTRLPPKKRFVRDFLQQSHVKSPKQALRTRLPQKLTCQTAKRAFRTRPPPKVKRKHPDSGNTHRPHLKTRTKYCACHEK